MLARVFPMSVLAIPAAVAVKATAAAATVALSSSMNVAVVSRAHVPYSFRTYPDAQCHFVNSSNSQIAYFYANADGIVRLYVRPRDSAKSPDTEPIACYSNGRAQEVDVTFYYGPNRNAIPDGYQAPQPKITDANIARSTAIYGFDPRTATTAQLNRAGLPPRPSTFGSSVSNATWLGMVFTPPVSSDSRAVQLPNVSGAVGDYGARNSGPGRILPDNLDGYQAAPNNVGAVALGLNGTYGNVYASFLVPYQRALPVSFSTYVAAYVGLDGGCRDFQGVGCSTDYYQAGVYSENIFINNYDDQYLRLFASSPAIGFSLSNVYANFGDSVFCHVDKYVNPLRVQMICGDKQSGKAELFTVNSPGIQSDTAQWQFQRISAPQLMDFFSEEFTGADVTIGGKLYGVQDLANAPSSTHWTVVPENMYGPNGRLDAYQNLISTEDIVGVNWQNYY